MKRPVARSSRPAGLALLFVPAVLFAGNEALFNGHNLDGWLHEGPRATFAVENGDLFTSGRGNYPNWLRTIAEYENFRLEFEYKLDQWAEAAVYLRAPRCDRPGRAGLAIVLAHDFHNEVTPSVTGAVAGVLPPREPLPTSFGAWHKVSILLDGDHLQASIDGRTVQDLRLNEHAELRYRLRGGYIGFPDLGHAYRLRNIRLENLGDREKFITLFDGVSLEGWQLRGGGNWTVRDGAIHASNGHGILYAGPSFQDFELTLEARSHNRVNSGVFLRGSPQGAQRGLEVQIYSPPDAVYPTGSIYSIERSRISADYEERWFVMQIRVEGRRCLVWLDGEAVAETDRLPDNYLKRGRIGLQIHMDNAWVEFRNVRVKEL